MDSHFRRSVRRDRAARRGVSLIEGMTASVVLLIGLVMSRTKTLVWASANARRAL